jgi:hypothetical protein
MSISVDFSKSIFIDVSILIYINFDSEFVYQNVSIFNVDTYRFFDTNKKGDFCDVDT